MSFFVLKLIALATMLCDHIAFWFVHNNIIMRNIGRLAFVIYAFLMAEGYNHLKDKPYRLRKHVFKLIILCLISEIPYDLFDRKVWVDLTTQNVIFTLLFGFLALIGSGWWNRKHAENKTVSIIGSLVICLAAASTTYFLRSDYCFRGVILIVMFYLYLQKEDALNLPQRLGLLFLIDLSYCLLGLWVRAAFGGWPEFAGAAQKYSKWTVGMIAAFVPLAFYNRKLGYHSKWFGCLYSCFYPLHLVVLLIARYLIRGF